MFILAKNPEIMVLPFTLGFVKISIPKNNYATKTYISLDWLYFIRHINNKVHELNGKNSYPKNSTSG